MSDDRVAAIDALVASGAHASRAALIIAAVDRLTGELEARRIDREIVEGYTRVPPTADERAWAELGALESVREEPW